MVGRGLVDERLLNVAIGDVLASDLRFKARDRADYLAYLLSKGKGVSKQVWDAHKAIAAKTAATRVNECTLKYAIMRRATKPEQQVTHQCLCLPEPTAWNHS